MYKVENENKHTNQLNHVWPRYYPSNTNHVYIYNNAVKILIKYQVLFEELRKGVFKSFQKLSNSITFLISFHTSD